jgi:hypothetical protein
MADVEASSARDDIRDAGGAGTGLRRPGTSSARLMSLPNHQSRAPT